MASREIWASEGERDSWVAGRAVAEARRRNSCVVCPRGVVVRVDEEDW